MQREFRVGSKFTPLSVRFIRKAKEFSPLTLNCLLTLFLNMTPLHIYVHTHMCAHAHTHIQFSAINVSISSQSPREYSQSKPWHWATKLESTHLENSVHLPCVIALCLTPGIQKLARWTCCFYEAYRHGEGWVSMKAHCKVEGEKCFSHVRYRLLRKKEGNRGERKDEECCRRWCSILQVQANDSLPQYLNPWTQKTIWKLETE